MPSKPFQIENQLLNGKRTKGAHALLLTSTALAALWLATPAYAADTGAAQAVEAQSAVKAYNIPAQPLGSALNDFGRQSGLQVSVDAAATQGVQSRAVAGRLSAAEALNQLLAGTGIAAQFTAGNAVVLSKPVVSGDAVTLDPLQVDGMGQRPVIGYAATRSTTATKTDTPLRDVPQSVTVVTKEAIKDQSMQSMADVVRYIPGVQMAQGEGNRDTPVLRGNSSTADFFVDGIRDDVEYFRDLYNTDRIEALKGPNAMIFGRGGAGGVINRVTKQADWTRNYESTVQAGSWNNRRVTADVGDAINENIAMRVTGVFEDSDSYRDDVDLKRYGINPTLALRMGEQTTMTVGYEHFHDERVADRGIPSSNGKPYDTDASTFFGNPDLSPTHATINAFNALIEHEFNSSVKIRNRSRYAEYDKFYQNVFASSAVTGGTLTLGAYSNATERENLFNQTDLIFNFNTGSIGHEVVTGVELGRQVTDNFRQTGNFNTPGGPTAITVSALSPTVSNSVFFAQSATDADNHTVANIAGFYVQDQISFTPQFEAVLGLRYDKFKVDFNNNRTGAEISTDDGLVSPRVGLIYKPIEDTSIYASYSKSYLPRSGAQMSSLTATNAAFDPEEFENYEIGAKWDVNPGLSLTAAIFRLDRTNVVVPDPANPATSILVDGQRTKGVELGVSGQITEAWSVMGGYAYQDGYLSATASATAQAGAKLANLPEHTFSLWNRYDFTPMWGAGLGVITRSKMYASTDNTVVMDGMVRLDGAVFFTLNENFSAQLNVENLLDEEYYANAHNNNNILPGSPRAARVSLTARF